MEAKSQDYNDNTDGKTDLCWHCKKYKTLDEFDNSEGVICRGCYVKYEKLCKKLGVNFIEEVRNQPHTSHYFNSVVDHTDVTCIIGDSRFFIRGYVNTELPYNRLSTEKADIFNLKMKFLKSGLKTMVRYGNLEALKEYKFHFDLSTYSDGSYKLAGNCAKLSNAFSIKSIDLDYLFSIIGYHYKITEGMKKVITSELSKEGFKSFCTNDDFNPSELWIKDYRDYMTKNVRYYNILFENGGLSEEHTLR